MADACRGEDGNPGLELGLRLGEGWQAGRDKVCLDETPTGFGLWAEQLLAESTGKQGKGLVPAPGEPADGPDRQRGEVELADPYELGGRVLPLGVRDRGRRHVLGINPFDQPDVQAAKDKTNEVLAAGEPDVEPRGSLDELLAQARRGRLRLHPGVRRPGARGRARAARRARARDGLRRHAAASARATCTRPASCTRAARTPGLFVQVVDETGDELPIPGREFGFGRLIRAQAAGDFAALEERGRRVVRVRLEDI